MTQVASKRFRNLALFCILVGLLSVWPQSTIAQVQRVKFQSGNNYLIVEALDDDLIHFELSALGPGPSTNDPIYTTPMVYKTDYSGPSTFTQNGNTIETADIRVVVDASSLCVTVTDKTKNLELTTTCPLNLSQAWKGLTLTPNTMENVYGLGEQFITPGSADGDWVGRVRSPGNSHGNAMVSFNGGFTGNAQFPIMYAVGPNSGNYALFLDQVYKQNWDFTGNPWKVEMWGDQIRWYVLTGADLPDLRQDYMELTGRPPVPPKKAFGLWISEYGYDNWAELDGKLSTLRSNNFPVDGFVMDLQWFGGIIAGSDDSPMGTLTWDRVNFPDPEGKIVSLENNDGVGLILIEESYVSKNLSEHSTMEGLGYLAKDCEGCGATYLTSNPWWGKGGMIDWTNNAAGDYWHDWKRQPLIEDGVLGHWTDLGEPEMYNDWAWYYGFPAFNKHAQADIHNLYNLKWHESIYNGYNRNGVTRRPFLISRSGASGLQRYGASMWSGDIGSNLTSLATHLNAQMHMSMSGIDYFGADIGGFHRSALDGDLNEMYTQWFANGMAFDVPGRPHTENLCNCKETAPDRIGDLPSNLDNVRQRYALSPYLYSLAHRAYLYGEPVVPPLVYYYQNDANVREMGHEKLLGRDLLVAIVAAYGETERDVYLPAGDWVDYYTNQWHHSTGQWVLNVPEYRNGLFKLPMFARAGAIIPKMFVDAQTMNILGKRKDGTTRDELIVRVYAAEAASSFTLYEDDGATTAYRSGAVRTTPISQQKSGDSVTVTIDAASGAYSGAPANRNNVVELVVENAQATGVTLNGSALTQHTSQAAFDAASSGWYNAGNNLILAKSGSLGVGAAKTFQFTLTGGGGSAVSLDFVCYNGTTQSGESVYVVGSIPELGNWDPANAVKLDPTSYPTWSKTISNLPPSTTFEWKCIKRFDSGTTANQWQPDPNNTATTPASGHGGTTSGDFGGGAVSLDFVCYNGTTQWGESVYVVGSIPELGNWDPANAVKLDPTSYPTWSGTISNLPPSTTIEWKCIKRWESGATANQWQPDPNNVVTTPASGHGGTTSGSF